MSPIIEKKSYGYKIAFQNLTLFSSEYKTIIVMIWDKLQGNILLVC